jgi:hypothetical protein
MWYPFPNGQTFPISRLLTSTENSNLLPFLSTDIFSPHLEANAKHNPSSHDPTFTNIWLR